MECPAECAGPVLAHLSLLRPESEAASRARFAPPEVGGGFQSLRAFRRTPLPVILRPDIPRDASEVSPRAFKTSVGGCVLRPYGVQHRGNMGPKWLPGSLLELLGLLKASLSCLGGLLGRSGRPLGRSWSGFGGLLGALGRVLGALGAMWEAS